MHLATPSTLLGSQSVPRFFGFGYAGSCQSALEVGGDFYEVLPLSDHALLLAVADVMGKGSGAALVAGTVRTLLEALIEPNLCPAKSLIELNELMFEQLSDADMFVTLQLAVADLHRRELHVASAGHCPLLLSTPHQRTQAIAPDGMPLGICHDSYYSSHVMAIPSYASILLYTDGITEARNPRGSFFGQTRLETWLRRAGANCSSADQRKVSLLKELLLFQGSPRGIDDQTFVILADETPRSAPALPRPSSSWSLPWPDFLPAVGPAQSCR